MRVISWNIQGKGELHFQVLAQILAQKGCSFAFILEPGTLLKKEVEKLQGKLFTGVLRQSERTGGLAIERDEVAEWTGRAFSVGDQSILILYRPADVTVANPEVIKVQGMGGYRAVLQVQLTSRLFDNASPVTVTTCHVPYEQNSGIAGPYVNSMCKQLAAGKFGTDFIMGDLNLYSGRRVTSRTSKTESFDTLLAENTSKGGHPLDQILVNTRKKQPKYSCGLMENLQGGEFSMRKLRKMGLVKEPGKPSRLKPENISEKKLSEKKLSEMKPESRSVNTKRGLTSPPIHEDLESPVRKKVRMSTLNARQSKPDHKAIYIDFVPPQDLKVSASEEAKQYRLLLEDIACSKLLEQWRQGKAKEKPQERRRIEIQLSGQTYVVEPNDAGGDCLFLAVAQAIEAEGGSGHENLRQRAVDHMRDHFGADDWWLDQEEKDSYLDDMEEAGSWAGDQEIAALSMLLDRSIIVHSVQLTHPIEHRRQALKAPIHLYHDGTHFEWMRPAL